MRKNFKTNTRGFVALISAILVSAILLGLLVATNLSSFYARFDTLDAEHANAARYLADACSEDALLRLAQNYNYMPVMQGDVVAVADGTCTIVSITAPDGSGDRTITASGKQGGSYANTMLIVHVKNPATSAGGPDTSIISWQEQ